MYRIHQRDRLLKSGSSISRNGNPSDVPAMFDVTSDEITRNLPIHSLVERSKVAVFSCIFGGKTLFLSGSCSHSCIRARRHIATRYSFFFVQLKSHAPSQQYLSLITSP